MFIFTKILSPSLLFCVTWVILVHLFPFSCSNGRKKKKTACNQANRMRTFIYFYSAITVILFSGLLLCWPVVRGGQLLQLSFFICQKHNIHSEAFGLLITLNVTVTSWYGYSVLSNCSCDSEKLFVSNPMLKILQLERGNRILLYLGTALQRGMWHVFYDIVPITQQLTQQVPTFIVFHIIFLLFVD